MNYVGQKGLRVNGNKVWHEGNFEPSRKWEKYDYDIFATGSLVYLN